MTLNIRLTLLSVAFVLSSLGEASTEVFQASGSESYTLLGNGRCANDGGSMAYFCEADMFETMTALFATAMSSCEEICTNLGPYCTGYALVCTTAQANAGECTATTGNDNGGLGCFFYSLVPGDGERPGPSNIKAASVAAGPLEAFDDIGVRQVHLNTNTDLSAPTGVDDFTRAYCYKKDSSPSPPPSSSSSSSSSSSHSHTSSVSLSFTLSGDVGDYNEAARTAIKQVIAAAADVDVSKVTLAMVAGSIVVSAVIEVADTDAAKSLKLTLEASGALSSASALETALDDKTDFPDGKTVSALSGIGWCCNNAGSVGDPHLTFALGGKADFRGSHQEYYVFLSSPGYQFAPYFNEADFTYASPTGLKQLVHGTFITKAVWKIHTFSGRSLYISTDSMKKGEVDLVLTCERGSPCMDKKDTRLDTTSLHMDPWQSNTLEDVKVETRQLTVSVVAPAWTVNVTSKPIYALVAPYANEYYESYHGRWLPMQRRLDVAIDGLFPQADAHGLIGQSYIDYTHAAVSGKLDEYGIESVGVLGTSDGILPPFTTSAQAEGAIEGVYTDYKVAKGGVTSFKYSRYDAVAVAGNAKEGRKRVVSSATEKWEGRKKEL